MEFALKTVYFTLQITRDLFERMTFIKKWVKVPFPKMLTYYRPKEQTFDQAKDHIHVFPILLSHIWRKNCLHYDLY